MMPDDPDDEHGCDLSPEIIKATKRVREKGFVSRDGRTHKPWTAKMAKKKEANRVVLVDVERVVPLAILPPMVRSWINSVNKDDGD